MVGYDGFEMATFTAVLLVVYFSMARSGNAQSISSYVYDSNT